ncbi:MAG: hypothetical protein GC159_11785 [Phycisphaera sp.]|nr:hypothetical protein [Phycisphaera sp.]
MHRHRTARPIVVALCAVAVVATSHAAEIVRLDESNFDRYVPAGKEVDAIYGDYVLRSDDVIAVIADPIPTRNANLTITNIGGCVIDLTSARRPNDQLGAFFPLAALAVFRHAEVVTANGPRVELRCFTEAANGRPAVEVRYVLEDHKPWLTVRSAVTNTADRATRIDLHDDMRADKNFTPGETGDGGAAWVYDPWWEQAYGVACAGRKVGLVGARPGKSLTRFGYADAGGLKVANIDAGGTFTFERRLIPAANELGVRSLAAGLAGAELRGVVLKVTDPEGPVAAAMVSIDADGKHYGDGRTDEQGELFVGLPAGPAYTAKIAATGRPVVTRSIDESMRDQPVKLESAGYVSAQITDERGGPIPCKVQFAGVDGTPTPNWFNDTGEHAVMDCYYSHNGVFTQPLDPGRYDVIVSYGPEYDAIFTTLTVKRGERAILAGKLVHSVDTRGWISTDYHSHSSPSGDNVSSQRGRVLNLLCENIEFAPCTEHQRIDSYTPHLEALGVTKLMATCPGIELTGKPLPLNHHNAFPLVFKPHHQDGGGPLLDADPAVQIKRLAMWDDNSDKFVQQNHPNIVAHAWDRDVDGKADGGYAAMLPFMDAIEVHPPIAILSGPTLKNGVNTGGNRMHTWLMLINQGTYIPGVVNTDAHYNHHGSGWLRNWVASPTDDPSKVKVMDVVHASERGQIVMSNGPFMTVKLFATDANGAASGSTLPGGTATASAGRATVQVRVQCPNWFDIDRVQVLLNGRLDPNLNFTRKSHPGMFADGVVKFDNLIDLSFDGDTHVIVVAAGESSKLGPVMGKPHGDDKPVAVSNPIFVDVDGGGFKANGDELGGALPK